MFSQVESGAKPQESMLGNCDRLIGRALWLDLEHYAKLPCATKRGCAVYIALRVDQQVRIRREFAVAAAGKGVKNLFGPSSVCPRAEREYYAEMSAPEIRHSVKIAEIIKGQCALRLRSILAAHEVVQRFGGPCPPEGVNSIAE